MMLLVEMPSTRIPARDYVLSVVFDEFLGLPWRRVESDRTDVQVSLQGYEGKIEMPDILLSFADTEWLAQSSIPEGPLQIWDTADLGIDINLIDTMLPVIFGSQSLRAYRMKHNIVLPIDVFGSIFFMLSRYEEIANRSRDNHGRFPGRASIAYREKFLDRPIVDEYTEVLCASINTLWPGLKRKYYQGRTIVTCDVDIPYAEYTNSWAKTARKCGGDLLKRKSLKEGWRTLKNTYATGRGDYRCDPYDTFEWMMDVNESADNRITFYFLCSDTQSEFDAHYSIKEMRIRKLLRRIADRGHEIGIHGGYHAYRDSRRMGKEIEALRDAVDLEGIQRGITENRQHYLRWETPGTAQALDASGIQYDSTLGYADYAGFRCGTSRPFTLFDVVNRHALKLVEKPLIAMDNTVIGEEYMGLGYTQAGMEEFIRLKSRCMKMNGDFTVLWHNSTLRNREERNFYRSLVGEGHHE